MRKLFFLTATGFHSSCFASGSPLQGLSQLSPEAVLAAIVTGLIGLVPLVVQAVSGRANRKSHGHRLAHLSAEVEFLEKWTRLRQAQPPVDGAQRVESPGAAMAQLDRIFDQYQELGSSKDEQAKVRIQHVGFLRRNLLLFLPLSSKGWFYHSVYYVTVLFILTLIGSEIINPEGALDDLLLGIVIIFGLPLFLLAFLANRDRKKRIAQQAPAVADS